MTGYRRFAWIIGANSTCAVTAKGALKCWGYNDSGQLGDGSTTNRSVPVFVAGMGSGVRSVSVGMTGACAVTSDGGVKCWGDNSKRQVGDASTAGQVPTPTAVVGLPGPVMAGDQLLIDGAGGLWFGKYGGNSYEYLLEVPDAVEGFEASAPPPAILSCETRSDGVYLAALYAGRLHTKLDEEPLPPGGADVMVDTFSGEAGNVNFVELDVVGQLA